MEADFCTQITAGILAGGESRRMRGIDKGLVELHGKPLIQYAIDLIKPQTGGIIINANRHIAAYTAFEYPIVADEYKGHQGPLAGIVSCMAVAKTPWLICIPCDSPFLPDNLVQRMYQTIRKDDAEICAAHDGNRTQPVVVLLKTSLLESLQAYLGRGERKPDLWYPEHRFTTADFSDQSDAFMNINSQKDSKRATDMMLNMT